MGGGGGAYEREAYNIKITVVNCQVMLTYNLVTT